MFNKCPHCGASYMDDDAEVCPSCEQPLKGPATKKPAAKKALAAKAAPEKTKPEKTKPAAPAPPKAKPSTRVSKDAMVADDDPFDIGDRGGSKAIPVAPKPMKGRMVRVECPMCETAGFIPPAAQGKEVRCRNKECPLPVFEAPLPVKEEEPEPEKSGTSPVVLVLGGLLLAAVAGGAVWFFGMREAEPVRPVAPVEPDPVAPDEPEPDKPGYSLIAEDGPKEEAEALTPEQLRTAAIEGIVRQLRDRDNANRTDTARRAAEAYVLTGQPREAVEQMGSLRGREEPSKIPPLVMLAERGDAAALDEAVRLAGSMPTSGRQSVDSATALAAALVKAGRVDEAASLVKKWGDDGPRGEYSALRTGAEAFGTFDLSGSGALLRSGQNPQWAAVTRALLAAGDEAKAAEWAAAGEGAVGDDALTAWAGTLAGLRAVTADEVAAKAGSDALAARMLAAAGAGASTAGRAEEAAALLDAAAAKLPSEMPEPLPAPSTEDVYRSADRAGDGLPDFAAARTRALAALKVAELQAALGRGDAAFETIRGGIVALRAATPPPAATRELVEGYQGNRSRLERELTSALGLGSGESFTAFNRYRRQVDRLAEASERRFSLQQQLARAAAAAGLGAQLVELMDAAEGEPWWSSETAAALASSEDAAVAAAAKEKASGRLPQVSESVAARARAAAAADPRAAGRAAFELAQTLNGVRDPHERGVQATDAAVALVNADRLAAAGELVRSLKDPPTREDVLEIAAARAAVTGRGEAMKAVAEDPELDYSPSELAAAYRGLVAGSLAGE